MATFRLHLMGQNQPLVVDFPCADLDDLMEAATRSKFLTGHMTTPDEDGVCRGVMIATGRIQCAIET